MSPASSTADRGSASWAITGVPRCWMLATLITSGSAAASTQTACGRRVRTMRSETMRCSRAVLVAAQQLLAEVVVDRGVGAAPDRARQGHGRDARPGAPHEQLRAGAEEGRLGGAAAEAEAGGELLAHRAEEGGGVVGGRASRRPPRGRGRPCASPPRRSSRSPPRPSLRSRPAAGRCGSPPARSDGGRASAAARARRPASRASRAAVPPPASSPGRTTAFTVRKAAPSLRQIETSGRVSIAGGSEDQGGEEPPSGSKAKPPAQTGPAPAGRPAGSSTSASRPVPRHSAATSREARLARARSPRARRRAPPGRSRGRAAPSRTSGPRRAGRRRATAQGSPDLDRGRVTLTSVRRSRAASAPRSISSAQAGAGRPSVAAASNRDLAGADHLDQAVGRTICSKASILSARAGDLDRHRSARDVDDLRSEDLRDWMISARFSTAAETLNIAISGRPSRPAPCRGF